MNQIIMIGKVIDLQAKTDDILLVTLSTESENDKDVNVSFIIDTKDRNRIDLMKHLRKNPLLAVKLQLLDKPMFNNVIFTAQKMSLLDVSEQENKKEAIN